MQIEQSFITDIKNIIQAAKDKVNAAANFCMADDFWDVGNGFLVKEYSSVHKIEYGTIKVFAL